MVDITSPVTPASPGQVYVEGRGCKLLAAHAHSSWKMDTLAWEEGFRLHIKNHPKISGWKHLFSLQIYSLSKVSLIQFVLYGISWGSLKTGSDLTGDQDHLKTHPDWQLVLAVGWNSYPWLLWEATGPPPYSGFQE